MYTSSHQASLSSRTEILEKVSADLLSIPPLVFRALRRKIARTTLSEADMDITPHHFEILRLLSEEGTLHASEIGERLQIAKAQMTKLIDRLVVLNIVERKMDPSDRRTYNITLPDQSRAILDEHERRATRAIQDIMARLSDSELENLSHSLRGLRDLLLQSADDGIPQQEDAAGHSPTLETRPTPP